MTQLKSLTRAVLGTLALALPSGLLALGIVAALDELLPRLAATAQRANWGALALEAGARWPELASPPCARRVQTERPETKRLAAR